MKLPTVISDRMNVSAQPKLSPFRYPGGKTRLAELVHIWLLDKAPVRTFVEPFAGGASIGLYVAAQGLAKKVLLVELDEDVASVWSTILSSDHQWLCRKILAFRPSRGRVMDVLNSDPKNNRDRAFRTLVRNRVGRSGLLWNGAGIARVGERENGLASRWYPETLKNRIQRIYGLRDRVQFKQSCGLEEIKLFNSRRVYFIDPPYTAGAESPGQRLYRHNALDHAQLFKTLCSSKGSFLMTHENSSRVRRMSSLNSFEYLKLPIVTAQNKRDAELLIGTDLSKMVARIKDQIELFSNPLSKLDFL